MNLTKKTKETLKMVEGKKKLTDKSKKELKNNAFGLEFLLLCVIGVYDR